MSNEAKIIRGQVRQVVKELLPEILKEELTAAIKKEIGELAGKRIDVLTKDIQSRLDKIDERSKEIQAYLVRATTSKSPV